MRPVLNLRLTLAASACLAASVSPARAQFSPSPNSPFFSGHNPTAIVSADFNGDRIPDLAIANQSDNTVTILIGDGKGNFAPAVTGPTANGVFPAGIDPAAIAVGYFNNDTQPDLAVADINGTSVTILLGDGPGNFKAGGTITTGKGPSAIVVADFDGDKCSDIATANLDEGTVTILFGDCQGNFKKPITLNAGKYPVAITAADLNADGIPDLAVVNAGDGTVTIFLDPGGNAPLPALTLRSAAVPTVGAVTQTVSAVAAANFKGHPMNSAGLTFLDLAVTYYDNTSFQGNLLLFTADEQGGYQSPPSALFAKPVGLQPGAIASAAFPLSGATAPAQGVAIANYRSGTLAVYAGDGAGNLSASVNSPYPTASLPRALAVADFNGDGLPDVAVANYNDGTVTVLLSTFATAPSVLSSASNTAPVALGSLVTIYGTGLASAANPNSTSVSLTDASGVVLPVPLLYSSPTQINAQVPPGAATGAGSFKVTAPQGNPQKASIAIAAVAPGLFSANASGKGPAAGYVQSVTAPDAAPLATCSVPTVCAPVPFDVSSGATLLVLYGTGIRNRPGLSAVTVTVGTTSVPVSYAGPATGTSGLDQINVSLPVSLAHAGTVYVQVAIGNATSNQVTVAIQ